MPFGAHLSIQGGIEKVPILANKLGMQTFQFFSQSPHGGKRQKPTSEKIKSFIKNFQESRIKSAYLHAPYFINLASLNSKIFYSSINAIRLDLEIASLLQIDGLVVHVGSAKDFFIEKKDLKIKSKNNQTFLIGDQITKKNKEVKKSLQLAQERVIYGLDEVLKNYTGKAQLILEISAGAGRLIGVSLKDIFLLLKKVKKVGGFCFDTAHAFASGIDFLGQKKLEEILDLIDQKVGLKKLKLIHLNDSKVEFNSKKDRHAHLGEGKIGLENLLLFVKNKRLKKLDFILETPTLEGVKRDLCFLLSAGKIRS